MKTFTYCRGNRSVFINFEKWDCDVRSDCMLSLKLLHVRNHASASFFMFRLDFSAPIIYKPERPPESDSVWENVGQTLPNDWPFPFTEEYLSVDSPALSEIQTSDQLRPGYESLSNILVLVWRNSFFVRILSFVSRSVFFFLYVLVSYFSSSVTAGSFFASAFASAQTHAQILTQTLALTQTLRLTQTQTQKH